MAKIQGPIGNDFCPQALFLYGTKEEDGAPHFGLFCWFSYAWVEKEKDGTLGVMACIGEDKRTKDLIRKNGAFSANLVTESLLPLADYYGNVFGRTSPKKMERLPTVEQGRVLDVPTVAESPVSFELKVLRELHLTQGSDMFLCEIVNVMMEESLGDETVPFIQRLKRAAPVVTAGEETYSTLDGRYLGKWGEPMKSLT